MPSVLTGINNDVNTFIVNGDETVMKFYVINKFVILIFQKTN